MNHALPPRFPRVVLDVPPELADDTSAFLFELGTCGVEVRDSATLDQAAVPDNVTLLASFSTDEEATIAIASLDRSFNPRRDDIVGDAWRDGWKQHFRPFNLTDRIVVCPPWLTVEPPVGQYVLEMDPGRAFGTGLHPTTRLVARSLERAAARLVGCNILDVGCGSGVLSLCALLLGAKHARAVDIDHDAVSATRENAERNGLAARVDASTNDVASLEAASFSVVVANIEARVLIPMAKTLVRCVVPGGLIILSGILQDQVQDVVSTYRALRMFGAIDIVEDTGWAAIELEAVL